jgi:hypothetical protein
VVIAGYAPLLANHHGLVVEAVDQITVIVARPSSPAR